MNIKRALYLLIFLSLFASGTTFAQSDASIDQRNYFKGQLYIKFTASAAGDPLQQLKSYSPTRKLLEQAGVQEVTNILTPRLQQAARTYLNRHPNSPLKQHLRSFNRIYHVNYAGGISPELLAAKLQRRPDIEYASPRYYQKLQLNPNDPLQGDHLNIHNFYNAWDESTGNEEVVIGIIDSGIDYTHEDLQSEIWINQDEIPSNWRDSLDTNNDSNIQSLEIRDYLLQNNEDFNGDGVVDLQDAVADSSPLTTGGDTDGNGYADDIYGWDFWQSGIPGQDRVQDNNPIGDHSFHGTHVAGIAGAATDNNTGVSGTGYNARVMAVKAGGIEDIPETNPDENQIIAFGYEGIFYAALNGADIINTSWGGFAYSEFERELLRAVTDMDVLVVSATGNNGIDQILYPAAFKKTLSVGAMDEDDEIAGFSNYGYNLDVLAMGLNIQGTMPGNEYAQHTGTSMSTPIVSGLAALVKSEHPGWTGQRIKKQIRVTSQRLDLRFYDEVRYQLGHGRIDAEQALTTSMPGVEVISSDFLNNQGQKLNIDEPGVLQFQVVNYGRSTSDLNFELRAQQDNLTIQSANKQGLSVAHNDTVLFSFEISIQQDYDLSRNPSFILLMEGGQGNYNDFHRFEYEDILFDVVAANNVYTSIAANGTIGFTNALEGSGGVGFQPRMMESGEFQTGPNLLFEGGLITSFDGIIQDAVRSVNGMLSRDFKPLSTYRIIKPGVVSDADGRTLFTVRGNTQNTYSNTEYEVHTYAFDDPAVSNTVYLRYDITNTIYENRQLRNVYVGLFNDWDLGSITNNATGYIEQDSLLYAYDQAGEVPYYVGVAPMNTVSSQLAINNAANSGTGPDSLSFGIYDGFTEREKRISVTAETGHTTIEGTDISTVVASGPYHIGPRSSVTVGFIYAYGNSLEQLVSQVRSARQRNVFQTSRTGLHLETMDTPRQTQVYQNYPNPFNATTNIRVDLAESQHVTAEVYNLLGQKVATLSDRQLSTGIHTFRFDGSNLGSGLYLVHVRTPNLQRTIKINLLK